MTEDETMKLKCLETAFQYGRSLADAQAMFNWIKEAPAPIVTAQNAEPISDGLTLEEGGDVSGRGWVEPPLDPMTMAREEFFEEPSEHEQAGLPREDFYNDPPVDEQCQTEPVLSADYHEASASSEPPSLEDVRSETPASDEGSGDQIADVEKVTWEDFGSITLVEDPELTQDVIDALVENSTADEPLDLAALTRAAQERLDALEADDEIDIPGGEGESETVEIPEGFEPWSGGVCPVEANVTHEIIRADGSREVGSAFLGWGHATFTGHLGAYYNIIAYRIISEPSEPEATLTDADLDAHNERVTAILEVAERKLEDA